MRGGSNLEYPMGEPLNEYGERMTVEVDFGDLTIDSVRFEKENNEILIYANKLHFNDTGY